MDRGPPSIYLLINFQVNITSETDTDDNKPLIDIMRKIKQKNKRSKKDKKRLSRHEDFVMAREPPKLESPTQIYPMDLSTPSCSR